MYKVYFVCVCVCVCVLVRTVVFNSATPWPIACQSPLSMEFPRQEYWSGLPFPIPRDIPDPGIKPESLESPTLAGGFFATVLIRNSKDNNLEIF